MQSEPYIQSPTPNASRSVSIAHQENRTYDNTRSVFDLSLTRANTGMDGIPTSSPSPGKKNSAELGDLRSLSHKPWSRSAEELGKFSSSAPSTPLLTSFQDKIHQYRTGSPSNSPTGPQSQHQHPFPTLPAASSSADLSSAPSSPVSLNPSLGTPPSGPSVPMLHVRSHSFTPKLPSKLSASKIGPPCPARKASNASERGYDPGSPAKDRVGIALPAGRGASPFAFGSNNKIHAPNPTMYDNIPALTGDTALLPPPQIIEPSESDPPDPINDKRVSQITFHSGFVNRATDFTFPGTRGTTYGQPAVAKGWKPFKLILRGTKLQFYKPPSDRAAAIKELFPIGIVPADEEEDETSQGEEVVIDKTKLDARPHTTRRKRAFWGRRTHPDLVLDTDDTVERGSLEALVHETVFATTFASLQETTSDNDVQPSSTQITGLAAWQDFALSVLFALPLVLGADKFEFEFVRCCTYLVNGANADTKEGDRARVAWLSGEYLRFHGKPVDEAAWGDFQRETIPDIIQKSSILPNGLSLPTSASLQALYTQSPNSQPSSSPNANAFSPNVGTFSPRPDNHGMMSLQGGLMMDSIHASGSTASSSKSSLETAHRASGSGNSQDISLALLDRDGFTKDVLFRFKVQDIAHSLFLFNRHLLEGLPENLTADDCLASTPALIERPAHALQDSAEPRSIIAHFLGSEARLHWLTKLVLLHVLIPDSSPGARASTSPGDLFSRTSRTYTRSEVVSTWIRIGELCRVTGDECSWRAIFNALCSRPVARLDKTWHRVDPSVRTLVDGWVAKPGTDAVENKLTFWGGDACERMRASFDKAKLGEADSCAVRSLRAAKDDFEGFRTAFSLCPRKSGAGKEGWTKPVQTLFDTWRVLSSSEGGAGGFGRKFVRHVLSPPDRCTLLTLFAVSTNL
jgi:GTPase-activating protein BEM2